LAILAPIDHCGFLCIFLVFFMPELAEVEYYRKQWGRGLNQKILAVQLHPEKKIFRGTDVAALQKTLRGSTLLGSETHGKQMLFRFSKGGWLGIHLGMTGKLGIEPAAATPLKHDHLVLRQREHSLVFSDPRQFGRVLFYHGKEHPDWWSNRPPEILSRQFTLTLMEKFISRHGRAPIKAVLLLQSGFPGIGNWMADEILWQSKIHPSRPAGDLRPDEIKTLYAKTQSISRIALRTVGKDDSDLPKSWLFHHRWERGGHCPKDGSALSRGQCGGRTTCWCPSCQKETVRV
jgi:formamidopyrimidine-DNA glycosylase